MEGAHLVEVTFPWQGARMQNLVAYEHGWSSQKSVQQNKQDRGNSCIPLPPRSALSPLGINCCWRETSTHSCIAIRAELVGRCSTPTEQAEHGNTKHFSDS